MAEPAAQWERRRVERRLNARLGDLTVPELRRMVVVTVLFAAVLLMFLWMVRTVIIAGFLGLVVAVFLRPVYLRLAAALPSRTAAGILTLMLLIVPILALLAYSYAEVVNVASYVDANQGEISARIDAALQGIPFLGNADSGETVRQWVAEASSQTSRILRTLRGALKSLAVAATIFVFTTFYVMVEWTEIVAYVQSKVPPRYSRLGEALRTNVQGVLYGAVYSTFLTQGVKSAIILAMNLLFGVPLAAVLAVISFIIGFFPIVGSWSVYLPVAAWLAIFGESHIQAIIMVLVGFFVNTLYISTILRPKIAAERSRVLNFYWMLVGLVTGVYTFGLVGILLGPLLIGLLKAIIDTITAAPVWQFADETSDGGPGGASDEQP
jgi:predicted PurR-regulated permease PerM